jgi:hypothetical protein
MRNETPLLNDHNKQEYPPMHKGEQNHELKMTKGKTYRYDDEFKAKARAHQFAFRENVLNEFYDEKNPQVILTPDAAKKGLIFCDTYRDFIQKKEHLEHRLFITSIIIRKKEPTGSFLRI